MDVDFSVVIPALGEAKAISHALSHIDRITRQEKGAGITVEVIVADGDPAGSTLAAIDPASWPGQLTAMVAPRGRAAQMNAAAAAARGRALAFLHADTRLPDGAFGLMGRALELCPAGAFDLAIDSPRAALRLIALAARVRSRLTRIPYGDQAIFVRSGYFQLLGGFPAVPIMEDAALMRAVAARRDPVAILTARAVTSARRWEREGALRATLRNWWIMGRYLLGADPATLARHYRPHAE